jgi:hypothetical protein
VKTSLANPRCSAETGFVGYRAVTFWAMILSLGWVGPLCCRGACGEQNPASARLLSRLPAVPLWFEANRGQVESSFQFLARGRECNVLLAPAEAVLVLAKPEESSPAPARERGSLRGHEARPIRSVRLRLEGANPQANMAGLQELPGKANYYVGNDPAGWHPGIPLFLKVQIDQVYPGVRLIYYVDESARLEYDFVVQPGGRPEEISLHIEGADNVEVDAAGNLALKLADAVVRQPPPFIYQVVHGARKQVDGGYRFKGHATAGFWLGEYDHRLPLVIDPTLTFSTHLGGGFPDRGWGIAVDGSGNVWVAGETLSPNLPTTATAPQRQYQGGNAVFGDGFVAEFAQGTNLNYLTYLGGSGQNAAFAIAVDTNTGAAFVTGYTDSPDFPIQPVVSVVQPRLGGTNLSYPRVYTIDAFVTKLNSDGTLAYSTYLGGKGRDVGLGIAVDPLGRAYVTGLTESPDFPTAHPLQGQYVIGGRTREYDGSSLKGAANAFVTRINADGTALEYSSFLGGASVDIGQGIALDSAYCAYVVGATSSTNFPTMNALSSSLNNNVTASTFADGFISKLSPDGRTLVYSSYLGGKVKDAAFAVAVDSATNAYVAGHTSSPDFPVTTNEFTAWSTSTNLNSDVFVMKLDPQGSTNGGYSVVFGGRARDEGLGIAVDANQNAYIVGFTESATNFAGVEFPAMTNFFSTNIAGGFSPTNSSIRPSAYKDAFVVELDPNGAQLFCAYLGGSGMDRANGIALDTTTTTNVIAYIVGTTTSGDFPGAYPSGSPRLKQQSDAFVARILFP